MAIFFQLVSLLIAAMHYRALNSFRLWEINTGKFLRTFKHHEELLMQCALLRTVNMHCQHLRMAPLSYLALLWKGIGYSDRG